MQKKDRNTLNVSNRKKVFYYLKVTTVDEYMHCCCCYCYYQELIADVQCDLDCASSATQNSNHYTRRQHTPIFQSFKNKEIVHMQRDQFDVNDDIFVVGLFIFLLYVT